MRHGLPADSFRKGRYRRRGQSCTGRSGYSDEGVADEKELPVLRSVCRHGNHLLREYEQYPVWQRPVGLPRGSESDNRKEEQRHKRRSHPRGFFGAVKKAEITVLTGDGPQAYNSVDFKDRVTTSTKVSEALDKQVFPGLSFTVIRFAF